MRDPRLDPILAELCRRWPAAWPVERVAAHLDGLAADGDHRDDVLWAWACAEGDAIALGELDGGPLRDARAHLATLGFAATVIDEAIQRARTRLIVDGGLRGYRGRGPLATFVRTAVVRLALDDHRKTRREADVDIGELLAAPNADPELEYMRKLYADHLVAAVRDAWQRLAAHERYLLSLRIYEGMSIDDLARVYGIHRASAARRAATARSSLIELTRGTLRERLAVGDQTLDSVLRILTTSVQLGT